MHSPTLLLAAAAATTTNILAAALPADGSLSSPVGAFSVARPGTVADVVVTQKNTLNGSYHDSQTKIVHAAPLARAVAVADDVVLTPRRTLNGSDDDSRTEVVHAARLTRAVSVAVKRPTYLPIDFVNNFAGGAVNAYITGLDLNNRVVFVDRNGALVYPSSGGSATPVPIKAKVAIPMPARGKRLRMYLTIPLLSGRVYFARGNLDFFMVRTASGDGLVQPSPTNLRDPSAGVNWGFVELTYTRYWALFANISYVDFVGFLLSIGLSVKDGRGRQLTKGLGAGSVSKICGGLLQQQSRDRYPWARLCVADATGTPIRVLSPNNYAVLRPNDFEGYWNAYVDQVWARYAKAPLTVNTQSAAGKVKCQLSGRLLVCAGDRRGFEKPTAKDIWGCNSGPFARRADDSAVRLAVIPRLCAAFVRSTLLLAGGNVQPAVAASRYYTVNPTSHYSRLIHHYELDGKGYAFPYDDVNPDGSEDASGTVASQAPDVLTVYIGAPPS
ncbi:glycoside hydrolase family 64 protein [Drechmeria coniospora]|uniref:Glycoside hydrolase family 64 protein n=1 Tax=Drechmeria coniospora TaxID=98403 RepID=A0A151GUL8_DRECN|nr:glycoside hydrolase family 64 protein [Drechmeria coniospora]KYK60753.1 glycoside hydrolase family 64 protein [Drechmeria coniospora]